MKLDQVKQFADRNNLDYLALLEELARRLLAQEPDATELLASARRRLRERQEEPQQPALMDAGFPP